MSEEERVFNRQMYNLQCRLDKQTLALAEAQAENKLLHERHSADNEVLAEAQAKLLWHTDNMRSVEASLRRVLQESHTGRRSIEEGLTIVQGYIKEADEPTALTALVDKTKEVSTLAKKLIEAQAENEHLRDVLHFAANNCKPLRASEWDSIAILLAERGTKGSTS